MLVNLVAERAKVATTARPSAASGQWLRSASTPFSRGGPVTAIPLPEVLTTDPILSSTLRADMSAWVLPGWMPATVMVAPVMAAAAHG